MKNIITLGLLLFGFNSIINAQQSHTLTAYDHYFTPDTLYIAAGDTVNFVSVGYHSATEVDSVDWANNNLNENGGFDVGFNAPTTDMYFVINTPGKYYYVCRPHAAMGMKGVIYVDQGTSNVDELELSNQFNFYRLGDGTYQIEYESGDFYTVYNLNGQLITSGKLDPALKSSVVDFNFQTGTYVIRLSEEGKPIAVSKFVVGE